MKEHLMLLVLFEAARRGVSVVQVLEECRVALVDTHPDLG